jgi:hypothetical protein
LLGVNSLLLNVLAKSIYAKILSLLNSITKNQLKKHNQAKNKLKIHNKINQRKKKKQNNTLIKEKKKKYINNSIKSNKKLNKNKGNLI